ncbi:MAG: M60 family metallopeptidase [bacterium]
MKKILAFLLIVVSSFSLISCSVKAESEETDFNALSNSTSSEVGYKKLDVYYNNEIPRNLPNKIVVGNLSQYPAYNNAVTDILLKTAITAENEEMYNFDYMDKDGNYYLNGSNTGQSLYKHTASDQMYGTKLDDNQTAVEKYMHINNSASNMDSFYFGSITTGLYAPAGELITIEIDDEAAAQDIEVYIGVMTSRGFTNDLPTTTNFYRMPKLTSGVTMSNTITYTGSPLGGLIYIYNNGARVDIDIKISGAVEATHYVVGSTTKEDLERTFESSAPLIEVDIPSQLKAVMPKYDCGELSVDMMLEGIDQWEKMTALHSFINKEKDWYHAHGVSALYDSYIPAGAAVAFVGSSYSIMPLSYSANFFDTSNSDWGSYHEYGHHYPSYDIIDNEGISEVSNNLITVIGYTLYSNYSGYRTTLTSGDSSWSFQNVQSEVIDNLNNYTTNGYGYDLSKYVCLLHSFGSEKLIEMFLHTPSNDASIIASNSVVDNWFVKVVEVTGYDMSYYFNEYLSGYNNSSSKEIHSWSISNDALNWVKSLNLEMYIPVSSEFQLGQTHSNLNEEYTFKTMLPFGIFEGQTLCIDDYLTIARGMSYEIISYTNPNDGTLVKKNNKYYYNANFKDNTIDEFSITIKVFNDDYESTQVLNLGLCHQYSGRLNSRVTTNVYDNIDGLSLNQIDLDNINLDVKQSFNSTTPTIAFSLNDTYNYGLFVNESALIFDESKEMTFYFKGLGDIEVYMGESFNNMTKVSSFKDQSSYDTNDSTRQYTTNVKANEKLFMRVVINTNVRAEFGASVDGVNIIPENNYYDVFSSVEQMNTSYYNPICDYNKYPLTINDTTWYDNIPSSSAHIEYQSSSFQPSAFKGNSFDINTATAGSELIYDYNKSITASHITFNMAWGHGRTLKDFEVWVGDDSRNLTKVLVSQATDTYWDTISLDGTYSFRYVKIVFVSCHYNSNIGIYSIKLSNVYNHVDATNENVLYNGTANSVVSQGNWSGNIVEFDGMLTYTFTGSSLSLFSNIDSSYGSIEIQIDDGEWITIDLSNDYLIKEYRIFNITNLDDKEHTITIKSNGLANIDYFLFS